MERAAQGELWEGQGTGLTAWCCGCYGAVRGNLGTAGRSLRRPCSGCRQEGGLPPGCRFRLSHFPAHLFHSDFQESSLSSCMWYSAGHWQRVLIISIDFLSALMGFFSIQIEALLNVARLSELVLDLYVMFVLNIFKMVCREQGHFC